MISKLRDVRGLELFRHNVVFFVGSITVGVLNYLLYPVISRSLSVEQFGEVQVLVNFLLQITILSNVVSLFVVNVVTNLHDLPEIRAFVKAIESLVIILSVVIAVIIFLFSPLLATQLQYDSAAPFWALGLFLLFNVPFSIRHGYLRARQAFVAASQTQVVQSLLRLAIASFAALSGFGVVGILFGLTTSMFLASIYSVVVANRHKLDINPLRSMSQPSTKVIRHHMAILRPTMPYMLLVTAISVCTIFMLSADTTAAKYAFDPRIAGEYSGLSVAARVIFFSTASVGAVLASSVRANQAIRTTAKKLVASLGLATIIGGLITAFFFLKPEAVVRTLVGPEFSAHAHVLRPLSVAILCLSLTVTILTYHVAMRDNLSGFVATGLVVVIGLSLLLNRDSIENMAFGFLLGSILALSITGAWSVYWHAKGWGNGSRGPA